jgi:dihydrolipoamide dehydrogenase
MTEPVEYDVAVIGAGIGGYVAAIRSSQLGQKVALIEKADVGGTCLNRGCIPTEALLAAAELLEKISKAEEFGIKVGDVAVDFSKVMARKEAVVNRLIQGVRYLIRKNKIVLITGQGTIISGNQIRVVKLNGEEEKASAKNIIIATGSQEPMPSFAEVDEKTVLSTRGALALKECPRSLAVIGGDVMGVEFAMLFNAFGVKVKILEAAPNLFPTLDREIGRRYERILKKKGIEVYVETAAESVKVQPDGKVLIGAVRKGTETSIEAEKVLIAEGRRPASADLGLEAIGVETRDGFIVVDEHQRTSVPNLYAVGDVVGGKMFAHKAAAEGIVAAENISGKNSTIEPNLIPICVYSQPEVASVGLSVEEAKLQGLNVAIGKFPLLANGRALALGETDGFAKVVCDGETGEVLGVHLIGPHATDIISEAALAMRMECTSEEIGDLVHPHPTISEALMEATKAVTNKAIHA